MTRNMGRGAATVRLCIGATLVVWLMASSVHAGTLTIAVTPSVIDSMDAVAQAFEVAHVGDRVRIVVNSEADLKSSIKTLPVQVVVSDNLSLIEWMEARDLASRNGAGPMVHKPLAIITGAETANGMDSLRELSDRMQARGTLITVLDPQKTDCGRRAHALLERLELGAGWTERLVIAKNTHDAITLVQKGKAHLGVLFAPDVVTARGVAVLSVSALHPNASVQQFAVRRGQHDHPVAQRFLTFMKTPEGRQVLNRRGYELIQEPAAVDPSMTNAEKPVRQTSGVDLR
jgi:molybdate transport system substrate-binding protein